MTTTRTARTRAYGVVFLALCLLFVWITYAVFTKRFTDYDRVTLQASKTGLSLPARADVKVRGVRVGEVLEVSSDGSGAELVLGLDPDRSAVVPANVTASILPKTLFGEKYVSLDLPRAPARPIRAGDTIQRTEVAIEVEEVLNDLFPLLRTVQPAELNRTLTALANTLEGRGERIGESVETLDGYLRRINPEIPALLRSLDDLGTVSATYESVVPELTRLLRNSVTTGNTFRSNEDELRALFDDVAGFSGTAERFLRRNGDSMVRLADQGAQIFPLLAKHSPAFRCFLRGAVASIPRNESAFRDNTLHIKLETLARQPRGYEPRDRPAYADDRGAFPYCSDLDRAVDGGFDQENLLPPRLVPDIRDGVEYDAGFRKRPAPGDAVVGTQAERAVLDTAAAAVLGVPVEEVPGLATLLLGPVARGHEVDVR